MAASFLNPFRQAGYTQSEPAHGGRAPWAFVANPLVHGLFALSLFGLLGTAAQGTPLSDYGFLAAAVALLPDLDVAREGDRGPVGHSLEWGLLWLLLGVTGLASTTALGFLSLRSFLPLFLAVACGLGSHWLLDAMTPPGLWRRNAFTGAGTLRVSIRAPAGAVEGGTGIVSVAVLVALVVLF